MCGFRMADWTVFAQEHPEDREARSGSAQAGVPKKIASAAKLYVIAVRGIIEFGRIIFLLYPHHHSR